MRSNAVVVQVRRLVHRSAVLQVGLLLLFWVAGEGIVRLTGLPLPGGVVGMVLMLALLGAQRLRPGTVRRGAQWLLGDMLLFFVPAVLAILNHRELLGLLGLKLLAVILVGTAAVMATTALTVELCTREGSRGSGNPLG
jgi:holin-like protein